VILRILQPIDATEAFRPQIDQAFAVRHWVEGLPSIEISVGETSPAITLPLTSPIERQVVDEVGTVTGWVLLWIEAGRISGLEYAWVTDDPPTDWPPSDRIIESTK
jgi:hypothetical protein